MIAVAIKLRANKATFFYQMRYNLNRSYIVMRSMTYVTCFAYFIRKYANYADFDIKKSF